MLGIAEIPESSKLVSECMQDHREEFEPFVEDEVPFDEYCKTMWDDGT
jgi:OTU domain-containing protein 3